MALGSVTGAASTDRRARKRSKSGYLMKTRLVLVTCYNDFQGPWVRARGDETGIRILNLAAGERIVVDREIDGLIESTLLPSNGTFPLASGWQRLKIRKEGSLNSPTRVDLVIA